MGGFPCRTLLELLSHIVPVSMVACSVLVYGYVASYLYRAYPRDFPFRLGICHKMLTWYKMRCRAGRLCFFVDAFYFSLDFPWLVAYSSCIARLFESAATL